jgi:bacterioferritin
LIADRGGGSVPATVRRRSREGNVQGDPQIIEALNDILTAELTAINQYFIHSKMCRNWGYLKLAQQKHEESLGEMKHSESLIDRILYLEGVPNMQRLNPVRVGEDPIEQHRLDLAVEKEAVRRLNQAITLCQEQGDAGSRELLEHILKSEEEGVDWLEAQLHLVDEIGKEAYLAEQIHA